MSQVSCRSDRIICTRYVYLSTKMRDSPHNWIGGKLSNFNRSGSKHIHTVCFALYIISAYISHIDINFLKADTDGHTRDISSAKLKLFKMYHQYYILLHSPTTIVLDRPCTHEIISVPLHCLVGHRYSRWKVQMSTYPSVHKKSYDEYHVFNMRTI
jgi:hypothetical protein